MNELEKAGSGRIVASMGIEGRPTTYTVYRVRRPFLDHNHDLLVGFSKALNRGLEWVRNHSAEEIAERIKTFFPGTDLENIATIVDRYEGQGTWPASVAIDPRGFENLQRTMESADRLDDRVSFEVLMTNDVVDRAEVVTERRSTEDAVK